MLKPLISIIIPAYNRAHLIEDTLNSIIAQTYTNWECIIIDDESTDNTYNIIEEFTRNNNKIKLYRRPKERIKGANSCRNYGFEISNGTYVNWFDSDDIMHPDFIKNKIEAFLDDNDCVLSKTCFFEENIQNITGKETRTDVSENLLEDFITLKISWYLPDPLWRKSFLNGKKLFSEVLKKGQDRDFHTRLLMHNPRIIIIDDYLTYYRQHNTTISNNYSKEVIQSYFDALNERIELVIKTKPSNNLKFFLLKSQTKNYPYLYTNKKSFSIFLKVFKTLFVFNYKNIVWFFKFIVAALLFNIFGKGSFILKE